MSKQASLPTFYQIVNKKAIYSFNNCEIYLILKNIT